jgi:hypothetical protein
MSVSIILPIRLALNANAQAVRADTGAGSLPIGLDRGNGSETLANP